MPFSYSLESEPLEVAMVWADGVFVFVVFVVVVVLGRGREERRERERRKLLKEERLISTTQGGREGRGCRIYIQ